MNFYNFWKCLLVFVLSWSALLCAQTIEPSAPVLAETCIPESSLKNSALPYFPDLVGRGYWQDKVTNGSQPPWQIGLNWQWNRIQDRLDDRWLQCLNYPNRSAQVTALQVQYIEPHLANLRAVLLLYKRNVLWLKNQIESLKVLLQSGEVTLWEMDTLLGSVQKMHFSMDRVEEQIRFLEDWIQNWGMPKPRNSSPLQLSEILTPSSELLFNEVLKGKKLGSQDGSLAYLRSNSRSSYAFHVGAELGMQTVPQATSKLLPYASFEVRWHPGSLILDPPQAPPMTHSNALPAWFLSLESLALEVPRKKASLEELSPLYDFQVQLVKTVFKNQDLATRELPKILSAFEKLVLSSAYLLEWKGAQKFTMDWFEWDRNLGPSSKISAVFVDAAKEDETVPARLPVRGSSISKTPLSLAQTQGTLEETGESNATGTNWRYFTKSNGLRAFSTNLTGAGVRARFKYTGDSDIIKPLGSGAVRYQMGLYTQALNQCNLVYVMVRLKPKPQLVVQQKLNKGKSTHAQCQNHGYQTVFEKDLAWNIKVPMEFSVGTLFENGKLNIFLDQIQITQIGVAPELNGSKLKSGVRLDNVKAYFQLEDADFNSLSGK